MQPNSQVAASLAVEGGGALPRSSMSLAALSLDATYNSVTRCAGGG